MGQPFQLEIKAQYFIKLQIYLQMTDQTYDLNRKLRYISKYQDNAFNIKYVIEIDPNNQSMQPAKNLQPQSKKTGQSLESKSREKNKPVQQPPKQYSYDNQAVKSRKGARNQRMKKKLQISPQQALILKNFNQFNSKKMEVRDPLDNIIQKKKKDKGGKKIKSKHQKYHQKSMGGQSEQQLKNTYNTFLNAPEFRKRMSRSIDNTQKKQPIQQPPFNMKVQKFYGQKRNKKQIYPPYQSIQQIQESRDAKQNKYFKGTIDFNQRVKHYARIFSKQYQGDLIVQGVYKNRCIHGDEVFFEILPKAILPKQNDTMNQKIRCKVVYILPWKKNSMRKIVGKIQYARNNKTYYLVPINKRIISFDIKLSDISKQDLKKVDKKYFIAEFTQWRSTSQFPECKILEQFGAIGEIEAQTQALLINNGVQDKQYDQQTVKKGLQKFLKCADQNGQYKIPQQQIKSRSDLRSQRIFTIDPLTAKDFDDALSIVQCGVNEKNQKIYQVGVHIADASYFVQEGGVIDEQAQQTTTSVYLVHRVLPMLPRVLCQTMCSLNPGLERLTISVWFKLTSQGQVLQGSRYDRSVIKSKARFTYEQAQKIITGQVTSHQQIQAGFGSVKAEDFKQLAEDIKIMNSIAMKIREARIKSGSLIFETPKKSFKLDQNFKPESIEVSKRFQANFLVQQYMLLANQKVGQILVQKIGSSSLLRRHRFPTDKKIQKFQNFTLKINQPIKINRDSPMQEQMNQVIKNPKIKKVIKQVLNYQMIFLLQQAQYFVVGDSKKQQWLHYALNMPIYTHFTSPIRRYPDIMVHRQLIAIINARRANKPNNQIQLPTYKKLKQIVDRCNKNKISAKKVSSGCQKIFLCLYLKTHPVFCKAVLTDLNQYCLTICVTNYDFRTAIEFKQLKKVKPLQFGKDKSQRKYVQLQCTYQDQNSTKIILKQMQEIDVKLSAKEGFPIDYEVRLVFPHPQNIGQTFVCL